MLPEETEKKLDGVDLTGFSDNYWIGLSLLHTLFVEGAQRDLRPPQGLLPHLGRREALPDRAPRQLGAVSAKIHTVEWTPGILANPVLERAMHANWYGVLPQPGSAERSATWAPR